MGEARRDTNVPPGTPAPGLGAGARCVILSRRGLTLPTRLMEGLSQRGARLNVVADASSVMVELARGGNVLIIHEPSTVRHLSELLSAIHRYYSGVPCWRFDSLATGQSTLARINGRSHGADASNAPAAAKPASPPQARAASVSTPVTPVPRPAATKPAADATGRPPLITREELDMLLAPDPEDGPRDATRETEEDA